MNASTTVVRSFELVEHIWTQVTDLGNALIAMTEAALKEDGLGNLREAGHSVSSYEKSPSGWCNTAYAISVPVMEARRRKQVPAAWINYQISLFGSGLPPLRGAAQDSIGPMVHVSFWHLPLDFDDPGVYVAFPPDWDDWQIKDDRLLFWHDEEDGPLPQWTFSIRLLELDSEDALRTSILAPLRMLLSGAAAADALPGDLPGLVFYANEERSESGLDLAAYEPGTR